MIIIVKNFYMVLLVGFPAVVSDISKYYSVPHSWRLIKDLTVESFASFYMVLEGLWSLIWFPCCCVSHFQVELSAALLASVLLEFYKGSLLSKVFLLFYMVLEGHWSLIWFPCRVVSDISKYYSHSVPPSWCLFPYSFILDHSLSYLKVLVDGHWIQHATS